MQHNGYCMQFCKPDLTGSGQVLSHKNLSSAYTVFYMVPRAGLEPARPYGQRILSPRLLVHDFEFYFSDG